MKKMIDMGEKNEQNQPMHNPSRHDRPGRSTRIPGQPGGPPIPPDPDDSPDVSYRDALAQYAKQTRGSDWLPDEQIIAMSNTVLQYCELQAGMQLYPYQREFCLRVIRSLLLEDGEEITSLWSRQCLAEGTLIEDRRGRLLPIESSPAAWSTGRQECFEVRIRGGYRVTATANHPFRLGDRWVRLDELKVGDYVRVLSHHDRWGTDTIEFDYHAYGGRFKNDHHVGCFKITPLKAELLGWLTADGSLHEGQSIKFTNTNLDYLHRVEWLTNNEFPTVNVRWYRKGNGWDLLLTAPKSRERANPLRHFIRSFTWTGGFPDQVTQDFSRSSVSAFLSGLYPADGYVHYKPDRLGRTQQYECGICCGNSLHFARQMRFLLNKLGVRGQIKSEWMSKSTAEFHRVMFTGSDNAQRFNQVCCIPGKKLPRGHVLAETANSFRNSKTEIDGEATHDARIVSIRPVGPRPTWDMIVPDKNWFIADGVMVHNSGKTSALACLIPGLMVLLPVLAKQIPDPRIKKFEEGLWVGLFGPDYETMGVMVSRMAQNLRRQSAVELMSDPEINVQAPRQGNRLELSNGSIAKPFSAKTNTTIEGRTFHLLILEEAQGIPDLLITKSVHPMGAATLATLVKIGTTNARKCEFYQACERNKRRDLQRPPDRKNHYQNDYTVAIRVNSKYARYIQNEIDRLGFDSDSFRMSYRLHWLLERGMFITSDVFDQWGIDRKRMIVRKDQAGNIRQRFTLSNQVVNSDSESRCVAGIDFGKSNASTVITIMAVNQSMPVRFAGENRYHKHILDWLDLAGDDHETQYPQILDFLSRYDKLDLVVADSTGVGDPIVSRLRKDLMRERIAVVGFTFSDRTKDVGYRILLQELQAGRLTYPSGKGTQRLRRWQLFKHQFYDLQKSYRGSIMVVQKPEEKGAFDDYPDSCMLACWGATAKQVMAATQEDNMFYGPRKRPSGSIHSLMERKRIHG